MNVDDEMELNTEDQFSELALAIDQAIDSENFGKLENLNKEIEKHLRLKNLSSLKISMLKYWQANVFGGLMSSPSYNVSLLAEKQIACLRSAISTKGFDQTDQQHQVQVRTNLGNLLQHLQRPIEAIEQYNKALKIIPNYGLTLANKARSLTGYARIANDAGHQSMLLYSAVENYRKASAQKAIFETPDQSVQLRVQFKSLAKSIASAVNQSRCQEALAKHDSKLGRSKAEQNYRAFCLEFGLFLNPLNDAYQHAICSTDTLGISKLTKHIDDAGVHPPVEYSLFNRIKQEYVAARYLYYEYMVSQGTHFSDRHVKLADTYDFTLHGNAFEKLRMAYRASYSVLDRVAVLVNHYWKLNHTATSFSFSTVWYEKRNSKKLHHCFCATDNIALLGLIEVSKDLHEPERTSVSEPDAKLLADLRNALEHRFVEITDDFASFAHPYEDIPKSLHVRIPLAVIESRTLRMLRIARSVCMYAALAINVEEQRKQEQSEGLYLSTPLADYPERYTGRL